MTLDGFSGVWLPEPVSPDCTYANRDEHVLDWLARSTTRRAQACRVFLNSNVARLPTQAQTAIQTTARDRWNSAFFELIVARVLQELGAQLTVEASNLDGKRPDFGAHFADGSVVVEAIAPEYNQEVTEEARHRVPLLNFLEARRPDGWQIAVLELPNIGPADSQSEFKGAVLRMLANLPPTDAARPIEMVERISSGTIELQLFPDHDDYGGLLCEPPLVAFDDTEKRIRHALKKKRQQVRGSESPVILAVHGLGMASSLRSFDCALYGRTVDVYNRRLQLTKTMFEQKGEFTARRSSPPTYAAVLAFVCVGLTGGPAPVLYLHPRFVGHLPAAMLELEQRFFDGDANEIRSLPPQKTDLMERLKFVQLET